MYHIMEFFLVYLLLRISSINLSVSTHVGINQTIELKDLRIANPSLGIFDPQRVCIPCYFEEVLK
jgi:hypothetical protein